MTNVTFYVDTLHGDADIFASRIDQKPNKTLYEKSSTRSNQLTDFVFFDKPLPN